MKKIIIASFIFFCHISSYSQVNIDWQQVATPDSSYRLFKYMSKGGHLYFVDRHTYKTYASFDYGKTWELLLMPTSFGLPNHVNIFENFTEDSEGNIYFMVSNNKNIYYTLLYKFDVKTKETKLIRDFEYYDHIIDIVFIKDGKFFLTNGSKTLVYDVNQNTILKEILVGIQDNGCKIYFSKGYKTYVCINNDTWGSEMQVINDSVGLVGSKITIEYEGKLYYSKGRFFNSKNATYSDDEGKTWKKLNVPINYLVDIEIGHDGQIFITNGSSYCFLSKDNGNTFEISVSCHYSGITSDTSGVLLQTNKFNCRKPEINYISYDQGKKWEEFRCNIDLKPNAIHIYAGLNENLFSKDNCYELKSYSNIDKTWELPINKFKKSIDHKYILGLPDGRFFVNSFYENFTISPDFNSIQKSSLKYASDDIQVKNDKLFILNQNEITVSEDFDNEKEKYVFNTTGLSISKIASNYRLFQYHTIDGWRILNLKTQIVTPLNILKNWKEIGSSYAGNNIYALSDTVTGVAKLRDYYIHQSTDGGLSFAKILVAKNISSFLIKMYVDHNENIYLLFEQKLFVSINEGLTWFDITPQSPDLIELTGISVSYDNYIYVSTLGLGIIRADVLSSKNVNHLYVSAKRDVNFNCVKDLEDTSKINGVVRLSSGYEKPLDINGEAWVSFPGDSVDVYLDVNNSALACNNNKKVFANNPDSLMFLVKVKECEDLKFGLSSPFLRRCFNNTYSGFVKNEGSILSNNSTLNIKLDSFFEFVSSNLEVLSYNHPYLKLNVPPIEVGSSLQFQLAIHLKCTAPFSQEHCIYAEIDSRNPCTVESKYPYSECRKNIGSYDPNDKSIFVAGRKDEPHLTKDDKLEYLIRFQNTGTDTAFRVKIEDYISLKYDIKTLRPVAASHKFDWEIRPNRNLVVYFNNIMLVDSFKNEPGSHGFIKFEIKLDSNAVLLGDTISNSANIYFDFNEAVVTNTVLTINGFPNNVVEPTTNPSYILYPNPTNALINIRKVDQISGALHISLYNSSGILLHKNEFNTSEGVIDLTQFQSGFYIVKISSRGSTNEYKVMRM